MYRPLLTAGTAAIALVAGSAAYAGPNLLTNGDFANPVTASDTDYAIPTDCVYGGATSCQVPETTVFVNINPNLDHPSWASFTNAGSGNDNANMLIVNGGGDASLAVWKQTLSVTKYETYQFTGYAASNYSQNPGILDGVFNGKLAGNPFTVSQVGTFAEFTFDWYSGSATSLNLALADLETDASGNDFSITNLSLVETSVPEPASAAALVIGLTAVTVIRFRRRRQR